ncbi:hypothetical protein BT96DRAFT_1018485 [Gymnopus androsaceus JB14]|uniref:Uncharacterized protein n=1 Tax=Gymnopus androsaceus JB14 TaxID=1447944 RepID=A0A6A4HRD8_9AGAR|nr:hypothetical protein BT96DRAFT_1018485 [Gymnopus androsaceus JB14]
MHFNHLSATMLLSLASVIRIVCAVPLETDIDQPAVLETRANKLIKPSQVTITFLNPSEIERTGLQLAADVPACTKAQRAMAVKSVQKLMKMPGVIQKLELHKPTYTFAKENCYWSTVSTAIYVHFDIIVTQSRGLHGCTSAQSECPGLVKIHMDSVKGKLEKNAPIEGNINFASGASIVSVSNGVVS